MEDINALDGLPPVQRRALAYERARLMAQTIITKCPTGHPMLQKYADDMQDCGLYLLLRHYYQTGEIKVRGSYSCKHRVVCPLCAVRMARKSAGEMASKLAHLKPYPFQLVTITQPDIPDYRIAVDAMRDTHKGFSKAWRNGLSRRTHETFFNHYVGGFYSVEVKAGKGSGMAHPHIHYLMHGRARDNQRRALTTQAWVRRGNDPREHPLSVELRRRNPLGGYICDVRDVVATDEGTLCSALMEVCKYVHDFKCSADDVWRVQQAIYRRRMTGSFGSLRGLKLTNKVDDDMTENEVREFTEYVLQWSDGQYILDEGCSATFDDLINGAENSSDSKTQ